MFCLLLVWHGTRFMVAVPVKNVAVLHVVERVLTDVHVHEMYCFSVVLSRFLAASGS